MKPAAEILLTCPWCATPNFTERGLRAHYCKRAGGGRGPARKLSEPALHYARKAAGLVPTATLSPSPSPMSKPAKPSTSTATIDVAVVFGESKLTATPQLTKLKAATIDLLEEVARTEKLNIERRLGVGIALRLVKASSARGEFLPWLKANVKEAGYTQCTYMMRLAEAFVEETGLGAPTLKAIAAGKVSLKLKPKGKPTVIQSAAADFIGGLTWGELLAKHEIKGGTPADEPDADDGKPAKKKTTKAASADELYEQSRDELGGLLDRAETLFLKENRLQHLVGHPEEINGVVSGLRALADKVEEAARPLIKPAKA